MIFSEFNKTVRACALICLAIVLWAIIANGSVETFLHPRSLPFVKISFFILCGLALYTFRTVASSSSGRILDWKVCILFLPIALGVHVRPTGLSSRIAVQKGLTSVAMTSQIEVDTLNGQCEFPVDSALRSTESMPLYEVSDRIAYSGALDSAQFSEDTAMKVRDNTGSTGQPSIDTRQTLMSAATDFSRKGDTMSVATSAGTIVLLPSLTRNACDTLQDDSLYVKLDRIYASPRRSDGKKVAMTGFIAPDTLLGSHSFFIARMMVSCCAADAMPIGFYCVTDSALGIHEGDWVVLSGQIEPQAVKLPWDKEKRVLPILRVSGAKKTAAPKRQYIYPVAY